MESALIKISFLCLTLIAASLNLSAQKALIAPTNGSHLIAGMRNYISVVAQQNEPVSVEQIEAILYSDYDSIELEVTKAKDVFTIRPDSAGVVEFKITLKDTVEVKKFRVKPLIAVGRLGRFGANSKEKISVGEMKVQMGLIANIECCDIDARCRMLGFEIIKISKYGVAERAVNVGAKFEKAAREIIRKTQPEDLFIFRKIRYRCPGTKAAQRMEDLSFEIK